MEIKKIPEPKVTEITVTEITEGSATPTSFQTSEESIKEMAETAERACYLKGWRLGFLALRLALCKYSSSNRKADEFCSVALLFFLVNIEVSIVGTSLISITDDLHGFKEGGWVVTGYLITYTSKTNLTRW